MLWAGGGEVRAYHGDTHWLMLPSAMIGFGAFLLSACVYGSRA